MNADEDGTICAYCQSVNRPGARFCIECGSSLPVDQSATIPISSREQAGDSTQKADHPGALEKKQIQSETQKPEEETRPLNLFKDFSPRPSGAVFADRFLMEQLIFTEESQHHYIVNQIAGKEHRYRVCPNQDCGAVLPPNSKLLNFCTDCGSPLEDKYPALVLVESQQPLYGNVPVIAGKKLSHGRVRAPLEIFEEKLGSSIRTCMIRPLVQPLGTRVEPWQVLNWGPELAHALSYLHINGIYFDGVVNSNCFALDGDKAVWADFSKCHLASPAPEKSCQADIRALTALLYYWLTGNSKYRRDARVSNGLNYVFQQGMSPQTFSTSAELSMALREAIKEMSTPRVVDYQSGRRTDVGRERTLNEDSMLVLESNRLIQSTSQPIGIYLVADGMGGHAAGEVASMTIVNTISRKASVELLNTQLGEHTELDYGQWLLHAIQDANNEVLQIRRATGTDLGSTMVAALLVSNTAYIAHVGDSRAYLIEPGKFTQITVDHSLVERLVASGQISAQEARTHPQRNVIYRTIGDKPEVEVDISTVKLSPGDRILLCSDGLTGMVPDEQILEIIESSPSPQSACDALIETANNAGGEDNITIILVEVFSS